MRARRTALQVNSGKGQGPTGLMDDQRNAQKKRTESNNTGQGREVKGGLRALTQSGEQFQPGVAIGRVHADLFLVGENGPNRVAPGTPINAIGLEALLVEATLNFLDFLQRRRALPAWELLMEWRAAPDQVAQVAERQGVAARRIVRVDRAKILSDQKGRP